MAIESLNKSQSKPFIEAKCLLMLVGVFNCLSFAVAIIWLYFFLYQESAPLSKNTFTWANVLIDLGLLSLMSIPHSLLLESRAKRQILRLVPREMFFSIYSLHASWSLIALFVFWRPLGGVFYETTGWWRSVLIGANTASWLYMGYALYSTGALKHNGIEQWLNALRDRVTHYSVPYQHAYKGCRHPIFLAFFLMIWIVPQMTYGRLLISAYWTIYLIVGTIRKEQRMLKNVRYRRYAQITPAYPLLPRRPFVELFLFKRLSMLRFFTLFIVLVSLPVMSKEWTQKIDRTSFEAAKNSSDYIRFEVFSTKVGIFTSRIPGYVLSAQASAQVSDNAVSQMEIKMKSSSLNTDSDSRDEKLHELCLSVKDFPDIKVLIEQNIVIGEEVNVPAKIFIRSKTKNIQVKLKTMREGNTLFATGEATLGLKELEIPDPSIAIAKLENKINIIFKLQVSQ